MVLIKNQNVIIENNKIISNQDYSTPGVYKIFDVIPNQYYKIELDNFKSGKGDFKLWVADNKKKTLIVQDINNNFMKFQKENVIVGIIFTNTNLLDFFYLDDIKLKLKATVCINICTYDRYESLKRLLDNIEVEKSKTLISVVVNIFDDGSPKAQIFKNEDYTYKINYYKSSFNHGKKLWYKLHNIILKKMKSTNYNFYYYISDDMILVDNFFNLSILSYVKINDNRKIAVNLNNDRGPVKQWTDFKPKKYDQTLYLTNWIDMCFICEKLLFKVLKYNLIGFKPIKKENSSSGVGNYISKKLYKKKYNMYLVKKSLVKHLGNNESKMNPEIRKNQPLISK